MHGDISFYCFILHFVMTNIFWGVFSYGPVVICFSYLEWCLFDGLSIYVLSLITHIFILLSHTIILVRQIIQFEKLIFSPALGIYFCIFSCIKLAEWNVFLMHIYLSFFEDVFVSGIICNSPLITDVLKYHCFMLSCVCVCPFSMGVFFYIIVIFCFLPFMWI